MTDEEAEEFRRQEEQRRQEEAERLKRQWEQIEAERLRRQEEHQAERLRYEQTIIYPRSWDEERRRQEEAERLRNQQAKYQQTDVNLVGFIKYKLVSLIVLGLCALYFWKFEVIWSWTRNEISSARIANYVFDNLYPFSSLLAIILSTIFRIIEYLILSSPPVIILIIALSCFYSVFFYWEL